MPRRWSVSLILAAAVVIPGGISRADGLIDHGPFHHGIRGGQISGPHFGHHRPFRGHVSGHVGLHHFPTYYGYSGYSHSYPGYRAHHGSYLYRESYSYTHDGYGPFLHGTPAYQGPASYHAYSDGGYRGTRRFPPHAYLVAGSQSADLPWRARMRLAREAAAAAGEDAKEAVEPSDSDAERDASPSPPSPPRKNEGAGESGDATESSPLRETRKKRPVLSYPEVVQSVGSSTAEASPAGSSGEVVTAGKVGEARVGGAIGRLPSRETRKEPGADR